MDNHDEGTTSVQYIDGLCASGRGTKYESWKSGDGLTARSDRNDCLVQEGSQVYVGCKSMSGSSSGRIPGTRSRMGELRKYILTTGRGVVFCY